MRRKYSDERQVVLSYEDYAVCEYYMNIINNDICEMGQYTFAYRMLPSNSTLVLQSESREFVDKFNKSRFKRSNEPMFDETGTLDNVKTLYIHPNCKVPRTIVFNTYKKCLNPWVADAVVIPDCYRIHRGWVYSDCLVAANHNTRELFIGIGIRNRNETYVRGSAFLESHPNVTLGEFIDKMRGSSSLSAISRKAEEVGAGYSIKNLYDARIFGLMDIVSLEPNQKYMADLLTSVIPNDRIVFESTLAKSLGCEDNKIDADALISISEMLLSKDKDVRGVGMKTLSTMDYMNYPVSVKYMLFDIFDNHGGRGKAMWYLDNAAKSTQVDFMMKQLNGASATHRIWLRETKISHKDWDVLKEFMEKKGIYNHDHLQIFDFMEFTEKGFQVTFED